jgi:CHASE3 domain sensor protein
VSLFVSLFEFSLFHAADALATANARIASIETELEASQKARDIATAAKATSEKTAKAAATKAKKAEKALADANQGRIQREEAITERLNRILALAGGEYFSILHIVCLLILLVVTYYPFCFLCRENWGILGAVAAS